MKVKRMVFNIETKDISNVNKGESKAMKVVVPHYESYITNLSVP